ncbi:hypothetical protein M438DRAFT_364882 [Aureobasidium pullulans EXF-150]|uniref:Uncharacterized protein n=1 Tax=Aureobasidium pullulans EXF-150 TaxID=1043002 RepID=A0A074XMC1_AURPU|nr:uncharacterized protein M438DRAFT_364882 [Aureobasidium pullulans EXF-150]KEQ84874.1 hypothetical protein M438DRAFT_364882 [Aureobasidium pullulans EXF-150]
MSTHYKITEAIENKKHERIVKYLINQRNFPPIEEIGLVTISKWLKAIDTGSSDNKLARMRGPLLGHLRAAANTPITLEQQKAHTAKHGENTAEPVLDFPFAKGRGLSKEQEKTRRTQQRNAEKRKAAEAAEKSKLSGVGVKDPPAQDYFNGAQPPGHELSHHEILLLFDPAKAKAEANDEEFMGFSDGDDDDDNARPGQGTGPLSTGFGATPLADPEKAAIKEEKRKAKAAKKEKKAAEAAEEEEKRKATKAAKKEAKASRKAENEKEAAEEEEKRKAAKAAKKEAKASRKAEKEKEKKAAVIAAVYQVLENILNKDESFQPPSPPLFKNGDGRIVEVFSSDEEPTLSESLPTIKSLASTLPTSSVKSPSLPSLPAKKESKKRKASDALNDEVEEIEKSKKKAKVSKKEKAKR